MATKVIDLKGLNKLDPKYYVYIGRKMPGRDASVFANPFKRGMEGIPNNDVAVLRYMSYVQTIPNLKEELGKIKGKVLACWCKGKSGNGICHGDVLVYMTDGTLTPEYKTLLDLNKVPYPPETPVVSDWYGKIPEEYMTFDNTREAEGNVEIDSPPLKYISPGPKEKENPFVLDRVYGLFFGACLGDSLGVPHEFPHNCKFPYTGKLEHQYIHITQYDRRKNLGGIKLAIGQYSDDTEMAITLCRSITRNGKYITLDVAMSYNRWANSGQIMMGRNTRNMFKGSRKGKPVKYETFVSRYTKENGFSPKDVQPFSVTTPQAEDKKSNGALMRCWPLAFFGVGEEPNAENIMNDVWITNPSTVAYWCELIHVKAIRMAIMGIEAPKIWEVVEKYRAMENIPADVSQVIDYIKAGKKVEFQFDPARNRKVKGAVYTSFYCSMVCLYTIAMGTPLTYSGAMKWIIESGGDTDTNAAIAGALVGALVGYENMTKEPHMIDNLKIMIASTTEGSVYERQPEYQLVDAAQLAQSMYNIGSY